MAAKLYDLRGFCLLADREYVGRDWFTFLDELGLFLLFAYGVRTTNMRSAGG